NKLGSLASSTGPLAKYLTRLAHEGTAEAQNILNTAEGLAHLLGVDTSFIDSLVSKISSTLPSASPSFSLPSIPSSILNKLGSLASSTGPLAKYLTRLAHEGTAEAQNILNTAEGLAHLLGVDTSF